MCLVFPNSKRNWFRRAAMHQSSPSHSPLRCPTLAVPTFMEPSFNTSDQVSPQIDAASRVPHMLRQSPNVPCVSQLKTQLVPSCRHASVVPIAQSFEMSNALQFRPSWNHPSTLLTRCLPRLTLHLAFRTCFGRVPMCLVFPNSKRNWFRRAAMHQSSPSHSPLRCPTLAVPTFMEPSFNTSDQVSPQIDAASRVPHMLRQSPNVPCVSQLKTQLVPSCRHASVVPHRTVLLRCPTLAVPTFMEPSFNTSDQVSPQIDAASRVPHMLRQSPNVPCVFPTQNATGSVVPPCISRPHRTVL